MNRREILLFAATVAGGSGITYSVVEPDARASVSRLFGDVEHMGLIGGECAKVLDMGDAELLQAAGLFGRQSQPEQLQSFVSKREQDFLSGRIKVINGWVLAEAECAVCALVALS